MSFFKNLQKLFGPKAKIEDGFVRLKYGDGRILLVSRDYYSVNGIRTPIGMTEVNRILKENDAFLPSPSMVDTIWKVADLKLEPMPMSPGPNMSSVEYYQKHNQMIEEQIRGKKYKLLAGHKKDIVTQLRKDRVTIYGWHRKDGKPIQPVSSVHDAEYFDYSHGLRICKWEK